MKCFVPTKKQEQVSQLPFINSYTVLVCFSILANIIYIFELESRLPHCGWYYRTHVRCPFICIMEICCACWDFAKQTIQLLSDDRGIFSIFLLKPYTYILINECIWATIYALKKCYKNRARSTRHLKLYFVTLCYEQNTDTFCCLKKYGRSKFTHFFYRSWLKQGKRWKQTSKEVCIS